MTHDTLRTLADRRLHELANRAAAAGYIIDFHPTLLDAIIHMASTSGPGARDLARIIDLHLARPLLQQPPGPTKRDSTPKAIPTGKHRVDTLSATAAPDERSQISRRAPQLNYPRRHG